MDRLGVRHFRRTDDGRHIEITRAGRRRTDTHRLVREHHIFRIGVGLGMHGDGLDAQLPAGALDTQRDFAAIGD
jgi:hypothetical protein